MPPASAIAILMASTPAGPSMSEYSPDMSVMKPMLDGVARDLCAWADVKGAQR